MRKRFLGMTIGAAVAGLCVSMIAAAPAQAAVGIRVSGTNIVEANGSNLILRGTSHAHTWYTSQTSSFANIKAAGANAVRVVLSGGRWTANNAADVANVVNLCKVNRLICVLENHDTTGYGEQSGAVTLAEAVQYWNSVKSALVGQENYVIINIGNEPIGNNNASQWTQATMDAIRAMRANGFEHALMIDAPNWGQDWQFVMRDNARTVAAADPQRNTIFSIHMYGVFDTAAEITAYVSAFRTMGLPLVIGEFGHNHSDGNPDEVTVMQQSIGWFGWSWSGNGGGVEYLDQVINFDPNQMTDWGRQLFSAIRASAREASIYSGQTQTSTTSSSTTTRSTSTTTRSTSTTTRSTSTTTRSTATTSTTSSTGGGRACSATYRVMNSWPSGFQGDVTVTAGSSPISGWTVTWTFANGQTVSQSWSATVSSSGSSVTASNAAWNGSLGAGASTSFGFIGSWNNSTNAVPSVSCTAR